MITMDSLLATKYAQLWRKQMRINIKEEEEEEEEKTDVELNDQNVAFIHY